MQFTTLLIDWRDTFILTDSKATNLTMSLLMELDPALTAGKNN